MYVPDLDPLPRDRIFLAIAVPASVWQPINTACEQYPQYVKKMTPPEKLHLTTVWLGDVLNYKQYLGRLTKSMLQEFVPTVRLIHAGRGIVRDQLWAYVEPAPLLLHLREQLLARLKFMRCPIPAEYAKRDFVPHVKIADLFGMSGGVGLADWPLSVSFTAKEILIIRSDLWPQGSKYSVVGRIQLTA